MQLLSCIFTIYLLFISRICCVAGHGVFKFIRSHVCPQTVQAYIDAGKDVNAKVDVVSFAVIGTAVGVGVVQVG